MDKFSNTLGIAQINLNLTGERNEISRLLVKEEMRYNRQHGNHWKLFI